MKHKATRHPRKLSALLCLSLIFPFTAQPAVAQNNSQITVQVGQPNIWSLGQAHYLLSSMRDRSRGLGVKVPIPTDLDPNSANGARLDVLRTLLSAGAEFNGPVGEQNRLNQQKFDTEFARYQAAQARIDAILIPYTQAVSEVSNLNVQLAALPADKPENAEQRKQLTAQLAERTAERDKLKAEIDLLRQTQSASALTLAAPSPPGAITTNTPPDDLKSVFDAIVKGSTVPSLNASTVLDNYVLMQYEVIAKQLTLLRDEVGPDQRLVFLELPMSLYSVPKRDDNYVVQLQWDVARFFGPTDGAEGDEEDCQDEQPQKGQPQQGQPQLEQPRQEHVQQERPQEGQPRPQRPEATPAPRAQSQDRQQTQGEQYGRPGFVGEPINLELVNADIRDLLAYIHEQYGVNFVIDNSVGAAPVTTRVKDEPWNVALDAILKANRLAVEMHGNILRITTVGALASEADDEEDTNQSEPITLDLLNHPERIRSATFSAENPSLAEELSGMGWVCADPSKFRVVDIIPRQSALNVNDVHGTQNGFALAAKFLTVFGLGGQVGYQRQRSIYEQFLQQEVYASAFGKGMSTFGWTFGPLPGTKRLAPGVRTTYAILVIPNDALAVELKVKAKVYRRDRSPEDGEVVKVLAQSDEGFGPGTFRILVPNERTEGFWVDSVAYTPVEKGKQATMIVNGKYFSPLTGVLINGVPLRRSVSIARNELPPSNSQGGQQPGTGGQNNNDPDGEYEYLNPKQLILSFKMGTSYVGTPLITLVTPEKTSAINFFKLDEINFRYRRRSLSEISQVEPMFTDTFKLTSAELVDDNDADYVTVYLRGTGLQRGARIFIGPRPLNRRDNEEAEFISANIYRVKFRRPPGGRAVSITYRNTTRQVTQEESVPFQQAVVSNYEIVRYEPAAVGRFAVIDVVLSITGLVAAPTVEVDRRDGEVVEVVSLGGGRYRVRIRARRDPVPLSVTGGGVTRIFDIGIPAAPSIDRVVNTATGKPEGPASKAAVVTLRGTNFRHVTRVLFGGKEATIMQVDPQVILLNAPPGEEGAVQILLETNINLRGRTVSNIADFRTPGRAIYTYTK